MMASHSQLSDRHIYQYRYLPLSMNSSDIAPSNVLHHPPNGIRHKYDDNGTILSVRQSCCMTSLPSSRAYPPARARGQPEVPKDHFFEPSSPNQSDPDWYMLEEKALRICGKDFNDRNVVAMMPPRTPQIGRLRTPELEPLREDHHFCDCCSREKRYWDGLAKMDFQLEAAMAHICKSSSHPPLIQQGRRDANGRHIIGESSGGQVRQGTVVVPRHRM
ncbi:hypothetical protein BD289DRAFT_192626 [Coniella lustricola]|uniref:Uncharacterized protein n=1 Tax=Coniella lustricola TaxID=2025994 RepID=A0A2T3ALY4_9PEZI|nr:hypothetical protein BD289DRAFT_192626 [Coniella lustricola]